MVSQVVAEQQQRKAEAEVRDAARARTDLANQVALEKEQVRAVGGPWIGIVLLLMIWWHLFISFPPSGAWTVSLSGSGCDCRLRLRRILRRSDPIR